MKSDYKIIKEEHRWTSDEKIRWLGYGEWVEEVDVVIIEYKGYQASVRRGLMKEPYSEEEVCFGGHLYGYVRIPENHPCFKTDNLDLDCHGGITFNESHEERWVGFDCGHAGDYIPSIEHFRKLRIASGELEPYPIPEEFKQYSIFTLVYRNVEFCIEELIGMIDQLSIKTTAAGDKWPIKRMLKYLNSREG